jgi:hypothetical protein
VGVFVDVLAPIEVRIDTLLHPLAYHHTLTAARHRGEPVK